MVDFRVRLCAHVSVGENVTVYGAGWLQGVYGNVVCMGMRVRMGVYGSFRCS